MTIDEITYKKPHLRDVLNLYRRVEIFERAVAGLDIVYTEKAVTYPPDAVDAVFKSFTAVFDIPEYFLSPLKDAVALGRIDFTRLPLDEPVGFSLPYHENELSGVLFLISRPFFIGIRHLLDNKGQLVWDGGKCPVCNALPSLSIIHQDAARRFICSYCGYAGPWQRIGCPNCQNRDSAKLDIIEAEEEKGLRIDLCNECRGYVKTAKNYLLDDYSPDLMDIVSIPLDIIAQGKGYVRRSPNPIGIITMI